MTIQVLNASNAAIVNKDVKKIQSELNNYNFEVEDDSKDESDGFYLKQPVHPLVAEFYYDKNEMVASSVDILAEDVILTNKIYAVNEDYDLTHINKILEDLRPQLSYQYADLELCGAGCSKIVLTEDNTFALVQLPQKQLRLKKVLYSDGNEYTIVEQLLLNGNDASKGFRRYYKIFSNYYPDDLTEYDKNSFDGYVTWLGESQFYNYYKKPFWLQVAEKINSGICIEELDTKTFNKGNNVNGIVYFNKIGVTQMKFNKPIGEEKTREDDLNLSSVLPSNVNILMNEINNAGTGNAFFYEESDTPMSMQYIKLSNDNYDYIRSKMEDSNQAVISRAGIPRERYMINDIKESMNSQKTQAFWEIYTKHLNSLQVSVEKMLQNLIMFLYGIEVEIVIEVPEFSEIINDKIKTIQGLFKDGLLTLRQSLTLLNPYISELDLDEIDLKDVLLDSRFINGRPLTEFGGTSSIDELGLGEIFGDQSIKI